MADYYFPTVVQPTIPIADMTPLERLLLTNIFDAEPDGDGLYFYAEDCLSEMFDLPRSDLEAALAESRHAATSTAVKYISEQLCQLQSDDEEVELDLTGTSWEFFFQDIVRRSSTLDHVEVVSAFTCSRMRPDGFGGMAVLITADAVKGKSTQDILHDFLDEAEHGPLMTPPGLGVHVLLTLEEKDVRTQIASVVEANDGLTKIAAEAVTDADIREACLLTVERADLAEERGSAIFKAAIRAIQEAEQRLAPHG